MSEDVWKQIHSSLHFVDESKDKDEKDPIYKIRPLVTHIINISQKNYSPKQYLTTNESIIRFSGRSKLKVCMPLKPIKYGFKVYVLCESSSGYMLNWLIMIQIKEHFWMPLKTSYILTKVGVI